jgi:RNA-binding motif protein, X-linked 2
MSLPIVIDGWRNILIFFKCFQLIQPSLPFRRNMKNVTKLSERELASGSKVSWHDQYKDSAWIFVGGLPYDLSEGDVICVFSQYGEIVNINLIRDKKTGKQKGFCFICYEDQRSTVLAVDNLNGIKVSYRDNSHSSTRIGFFPRFVCSSEISPFVSQQLLGKSLRVDHVSNYKVPKDHEDYDDTTRRLHDEGCAPVPQLPPQLIKREESRRPVKKERSPSPADIRRVKRERNSSSRERKVCSLSFTRVACYRARIQIEVGSMLNEPRMTVEFPLETNENESEERLG